MLLTAHQNNVGNEFEVAAKEAIAPMRRQKFCALYLWTRAVDCRQVWPFPLHLMVEALSCYGQFVQCVESTAEL